MSCFLPLNPSIQRRWRRLHALDRVMMERSRTAGGFEKRTSLFLLFGATNIHPTMVRSYVCGYIFLIYWLVLLLYQKDNCQKLPKSYNLASIGLFGGAFQLRLLWTIKPVTFDMEGAGYCACLEFEERDVLLTLNPKKLPSNVHVCAAGCTEMAHPDVQNRISNKQLDLWRPLAKKNMVSPEVRWCFSFKFKWLGVHDPTKVIFRSLKEPYLGCIQCMPWIRLQKRNASFRANLILERLDKQSLSKYQWVPLVHHLNWKGFLNLVRQFWGWVFAYISRIHTASISAYLHCRYLKCLVTGFLDLFFFMFFLFSSYHGDSSPFNSTKNLVKYFGVFGSIEGSQIQR